MKIKGTNVDFYTYLDKDGNPLVENKEYKVQHCIGIYGQTKTTVGKLKSVDSYGGMYLYDIKEYQDVQYIASIFEHIGNHTLRGHKILNDFEHGHESWIKPN